MNPGSICGPGANVCPVSLCLLPDFDCSTLADLLNAFYRQGQYAVSLDLCKGPRLGPVEIRTLGAFAEAFRRRGGFLKLENVSENARMIIEVFRFDNLLSPAPGAEAAPPSASTAGKLKDELRVVGRSLTRTPLADFNW